jgi:hypothetical protein
VKAAPASTPWMNSRRLKSVNASPIGRIKDDYLCLASDSIPERKSSSYCRTSSYQWAPHRPAVLLMGEDNSWFVSHSKASRNRLVESVRSSVLD